RGHRLAARVVDEQGEPLPKVEVGMWASAAPGTFPLCLTDEQGRFASNSLPAACRFTFSKRGYLAVPPRRLELDAEEEAVVVMQRPPAVQAKVVSAANGQAVQAFEVGNALRHFEV